MAFKDRNTDGSRETKTLSEVAKGPLPVKVQLSEGYLGNTESESISAGDFLVLECVKSVQKVNAIVISSLNTSVHEDWTGYTQPNEIIIPLGYQGKVLIIRPNSRPYCSVPELLRDFPRYVRVESEFVAKSSRDKTIQVKVGKRLKLLKYLPTQGLVAKYEGGSIIISKDVTGRFVPLPDGTHYTLKEIVDSLPLPQCVGFVEDEFEKVLTTDLEGAIDNIQAFSGCVKLTRVFTEDVVVGHHTQQHDQALEKMRIETEKYVERGIVLLPLGRKDVNDIEVHVPINSDQKEYELLAVRNFSQKTPTMDIVEGSLYLELSRKPRSFHKIKKIEIDDDNEMTPSEDPPKIPPRPPRSKTTNMVLNEKEDPIDVYTENFKATNSRIHELVFLPLTTKIGLSEDDKPPQCPPRSKNSISEELDHEYEPIEYFEKKKCGTAPICVPPRSKQPLSPNAVCSDYKTKPLTSPTLRSPKEQIFDYQSKDNSSRIYNAKTFSRLSYTMSLMSSPGEEKNMAFNQEDCENDSSDVYDIPDFSKMLPYPPINTQIRPIGKIRPSTRSSHSQREPHISQMSVKELVSCLHQCALTKLADLCDEHKMDGEFIADIDEDDLSKEPFSLNLIEIAKFNKMKEGWRPRIE